MLNVTVIPVTHYAQNCSLIWDDETMEGAVIDPGGDLERIKEEVAKNKVKLTKILLTHAHIDHAGATADLAEQDHLPIIGPHKGDQGWIDQIPSLGGMMGFPNAKKFTPDQWLEGGEKIKVGNAVLEVRHCPGHTPGHVIFYNEELKVAFVGDVLFQGSIGRTDFPGGNFDTLIASIREQLWPLGNEVTFVPGHGPTSTFGQERKTNPFVADGV